MLSPICCYSAKLTYQESTLEVVVIAFGGWILSRKGIMNRSVQKSLSAVNLNLFTPCLIFSKLASSLNLGVLADLWAMPLLFMLVCGVSWIVAKTSSRLGGLGKRWEKFVISCCLFQNVYDWLTVLIPSPILCRLPSPPVWLTHSTRICTGIRSRKTQQSKLCRGEFSICLYLHSMFMCFPANVGLV
jgi:hypothetical protein